MPVKQAQLVQEQNDYAVVPAATGNITVAYRPVNPTSLDGLTSITPAS